MKNRRYKCGCVAEAITVIEVGQEMKRIHMVVTYCPTHEKVKKQAD